jgi:hypothetical protein
MALAAPAGLSECVLLRSALRVERSALNKLLQKNWSKSKSRR